MKFFILFNLFLFTLSACRNKDQNAVAKDVDPEAIFYDYKVWGDEDRENVSVMLQYRFGRGQGRTLMLEDPASVELDGTVLKADSANFTGNFYEAVKGLKDFSGEHRIVFTDKNKKIHEELFRFEPFALDSELPEGMKKKPFTIRLKGLPAKETKMRLVMVDTAYATTDVNDELLVANGELKVDSAQLANLATGPVTMEIYREEERLLKNLSRKGGRLLITYGLRRQFEFTQ